MEAVSATPADILAWAKEHGIESDRLAVINAGRIYRDLPPFKQLGVHGPKHLVKNEVRKTVDAYPGVRMAEGEVGVSGASAQMMVADDSDADAEGAPYYVGSMWPLVVLPEVDTQVQVPEEIRNHQGGVASLTDIMEGDFVVPELGLDLPCDVESQGVMRETLPDVPSQQEFLAAAQESAEKTELSDLECVRLCLRRLMSHEDPDVSLRAVDMMMRSLTEEVWWPR